MWRSKKQHYVRNSSASETCNIFIYFLHLLDGLAIITQAKLTTDSRSTYDLAPSLKEPEQSLNKVEFAAFQECFTSCALCSLHWSPGSHHIVDALPKNSRVAPALHLRVLGEGTYAPHQDHLTKFAIESISSTKGRCGTSDNTLSILYDKDPISCSHITSLLSKAPI